MSAIEFQNGYIAGLSAFFACCQFAFFGTFGTEAVGALVEDIHAVSRTRLAEEPPVAYAGLIVASRGQSRTYIHSVSLIDVQICPGSLLDSRKLLKQIRAAFFLTRRTSRHPNFCGSLVLLNVLGVYETNVPGRRAPFVAKARFSRPKMLDNSGKQRYNIVIKNH
jgi:hypothetical protein